MTLEDRFTYRQSAGMTALSASLSDFTYKKHCHEEYAMGVTLRGVQQYHLEGSMQSSVRGGVMLFHPEQTHDGKAHDRTGIDYVMVYVHPDLFLEALGKKDVLRFKEPIVYHAGLRQSLLALSQAISEGRDEALYSDLLFKVAGHVSQDILEPMNIKDRAFTEKAKEMMRSDLQHVLRLDEISFSFGMSKYQFIRAFKANAGISPYQYFVNCRVEQAKQVIEQHKDIYLAVSSCGFVDLAHLNRHFKQVYGTTAFEYLSYVEGNM